MSGTPTPEPAQVPKQAAHTKTLQEELINFRVKVSLAGRDSYGASAEWREGNHDDLVLALALALWHGENRVTPIIWVVVVYPHAAERFAGQIPGARRAGWLARP